MSQLMFWNKQNNNKQEKDKDKDKETITNGNASEAKNSKRNWLHAPDALVNGHVVYLVKFFGNLMVDQPKGIEVVKDAIRKLQFAQQMKKAETGTQEKFKKVEITISVDGVAVQEPRTQKILHQFPLHNISYCADEKGVKKFFGFIAKTVKPSTMTDVESSGMNGNGYGIVGGGGGGGGSISNGSTSSNVDDTHECFIFISSKLASDITLTIGQAFDLAYRKYVNNNEKTDLGKAHQHINNLEKTINLYKNRLRELSAKLPKHELDSILYKMCIKDITDVPIEAINTVALTNGNVGKLTNDDKLLIDTNSTKSSSGTSGSSTFLPIVPPRNNIPSQILTKSNSQKMDELLLNSDSDSDFDPRADEVLDSGGSGSGSGSVKNSVSNDLFGFEPSKSYGQQLFFNNNDNKLLNNNNGSNSSSSSNNITNNLIITNSNNSNNNNSFSNEMILTPPLLAPPPKVAAPRRSTSVPSNTPNNGNTDLFGSDPFELNGPSIFKSKLNIDDFSLESLDPLRK